MIFIEHGKWWFCLDGKCYGPYETRHDAIFAREKVETKK